MNKKITIKELKQIQLNILESIDKFCTENNLQYFLAYGTLIGAVRHKGYIPWDDDIDICMPRPDYEKFIKKYNQYPYAVIDHRNSPNYLIPFAKVHDIRTSMNETMYVQNDFGVYVDVFPLDGIKDFKKAKIVTTLRHFLNTKKAILGNKRSFKKNLIISISKVLLSPISIRSILRKMDSIAQEIDYDKAYYVNSFFSSTAYKEIFPKDIFNGYKLAKFEHLTCRIPKSYDEYLRINYGDYMKFPPKEKQVSHHVFNAWWK